jgi:hypothetical protein
VAAIGFTTLVVTAATTDSPAGAPSAAQPQMQLPPGWTMDDMQACLAAGTPSEMHKRLAEGVGTWHGESSIWMAPGTPPLKSECTSVVTPIMDGRFTKCELDGQCPIMGPYSGFGILGFDNVSQQVVATWIDSHSTGIMFGKGELSSEGKVLTLEFESNCPITKKPTLVREVETITGPKSKTFEMFGTDPKSGEEFKMMHIVFTKE